MTNLYRLADQKARRRIVSFDRRELSRLLNLYSMRVASGEWRGKAGGYAAQGIAGSFIVKIVGSYSNVVGLPLYEVTTLLSGEGFPIRAGWLNAM